MHKQQRRMTGRRFTLIEIAVAMSIFALLMLILMQIFSATQNVWRTSSGKTDTYESTRSFWICSGTDWNPRSARTLPRERNFITAKPIRNSGFRP